MTRTSENHVSRLGVTGGRDYDDQPKLYGVLDKIDPDVVIVGDCPTGADKFTRQWAAERGVPLMVFPAHWDYYDKSAGPMRNGWMLRFGHLDALVSFPGGRGTADMTRQARSCGCPIRHIT